MCRSGWAVRRAPHIDHACDEVKAPVFALHRHLTSYHGTAQGRKHI